MKLNEVTLKDIVPLRLTKVQQKTILTVLASSGDPEAAYENVITSGAAEKALTALTVLSQLKLLDLEGKSVSVSSEGMKLARKEGLIDSTDQISDKGQKILGVREKDVEDEEADL